MNEDISVFICEDDAVSKEIIEKYFSKGKVSYAATFKTYSRAKIVEALDNIQEEELT